jgi:hypothetical protein
MRVIIWVMGLFSVWLLYILLRDNRSIRVTEYFLQVVTPLSLGILDLSYRFSEMKLVTFRSTGKSARVMIIETNKSKKVRLRISDSNILVLIQKLKANEVNVQNNLDI